MRDDRSIYSGLYLVRFQASCRASRTVGRLYAGMSDRGEGYHPIECYGLLRRDPGNSLARRRLLKRRSSIRACLALFTLGWTLEYVEFGERTARICQLLGYQPSVFFN
jgi:hypothetical protein